MAVNPGQFPDRRKKRPETTQMWSHREKDENIIERMSFKKYKYLQAFEHHWNLLTYTSMI